jgi:uncharacterized membrane protein YcjF (UPF0283 family)
VVYEIRKEHLAPVLEARPEAAEAISQIVAQRQVAAERALAEVVVEEPEKRVRSLTKTVLGKIKAFFSLALGGGDHVVATPLPKQSL